jgi:hypothetical protein
MAVRKRSVGRVFRELSDGGVEQHPVERLTLRFVKGHRVGESERKLRTVHFQRQASPVHLERESDARDEVRFVPAERLHLDVFVSDFENPNARVI